MGLYGDLPQAKKTAQGADGASANEPWSSVAPAAAPPKPQQPKFAATAFTPSALLRGGRGQGRGAPLGAPGLAGGRGAGRGPTAIAEAPAPCAPSPWAPASAPPPSSAGAAGPPAINIPAVPANTSILSRLLEGTDIKDEYDPRKPNDYEAVLRERERKRREAAEEADRQAELRQLEQAEMERERQEEEARQLVRQAALAAQQQLAAAAAAAPSASSSAAAPADGASTISTAAEPAEEPAATTTTTQQQQPMSEEAWRAAMDVSAEEAFARRGRLSSRPAAAAPPAASTASAGPTLPLFGAAPEQAAAAPPPPSSVPQMPAAQKGMSLAQRLMEKMGWREGQGLGRNQQGISTPLIAQKTDHRSAIITAAPLTAAQQAAAAAAAAAGASSDLEPPSKVPRTSEPLPFAGQPSKVVVLRNMVGPGEVDATLEDEVGTELLKYGNVTDVVIFEVTSPGYPPEEAVRIFVRFDGADAAGRALADLQGRFFAGRQVRAAFFPEARFDASDLAPLGGEFEPPK